MPEILIDARREYYLEIYCQLFSVLSARPSACQSVCLIILSKMPTIVEKIAEIEAEASINLYKQQGNSRI